MWLLDSSYIVSSINTALGKIRTLICSIKFFFEVVLCLYKFNIQTYTWNTIVMSGLVLLFVSAYMFDKLAKSVCRTVGNTVCFSSILAHRRNVAREIAMVDVHLNSLNLAHFLIITEGLLVILSNCLILSSPFPKCYKGV